ncbi:unnamed protein product [Phytomonas sp. EM1]|nr:unnamed protein product [Phytomonas sp. EM1]|eukprot:CCW62120.1 unnamed protein product [Phytomonas sp. isolate EM1]
MELGKLSTSSSVGHIFYFIIDENSVDEPSTSSQRYYYVVSHSPSYVEAFNFLCHSLCDVKDEERLRQWHRAHSKVFGALRFEIFYGRILGAPCAQVTGTDADTYTNGNGYNKNKNERIGCSSVTTLSLPALFADEASARLALDNLDLKCDKLYSKQLEEVSARQQNSCTPESKKLKNLNDLSPDDVVSQIIDRPSVHEKTHQKALPSVETQWPNNNARDLRNKRNGVPKMPLYGTRGPAIEAITQEDPPKPDTRRSTAELRSMIMQLKLASEEKSYQLQKDVNEMKELLHDGQNRNDKFSVREKGYQETKKSLKELEKNYEVTVKAMEAKLSQMEILYATEKESHALDAEHWEAENLSLQEKLRAMSHEHGEKLYNIVKENQQAMEKLNKQMLQKEEELRSMYEDTIQDRDVRLAQLSEELMKAKHQAFLLESKSRVRQSRHKEVELTNSIKNYQYPIEQNKDHQKKPHFSKDEINATQNQFTYCKACMSTIDAAHEQKNRLIPSLTPTQRDTLKKEVFAGMHSSSSPYPHEKAIVPSSLHANAAHLEEKYQQLESNYTNLLQEKKTLEITLYNTECTVAQQQIELQNASYLIESLIKGLDNVKAELPMIQERN